jgi:hypothetical protein
MEIRADAGQHCQTLRIGINQVTGSGMRHTNTVDSPTARDNSPASLVSVPCVVYPAIAIGSCVLLLLEGDGARVPFRLFLGQFNSSACLKLGRRWLSCWEVRHHTSKREWDQHVLSILVYLEGI